MIPMLVDVNVAVMSEVPLAAYWVPVSTMRLLLIFRPEAPLT
jgi:hypothetical protein